jgi:hypothetical protein
VNVWTKRKRFEKLRYLHRNQHLDQDAARKAQFQSLHHRMKTSELSAVERPHFSQRTREMGHPDYL